MTAENMADIEERVTQLVCSIIEPVPSTPLARDLALFDANLIDSFGVLQLVEMLEAEFGISLRNEDLVVQNFADIRSISGLVQQRLAK